MGLPLNIIQHILDFEEVECHRQVCSEWNKVQKMNEVRRIREAKQCGASDAQCLLVHPSWARVPNHLVSENLIGPYHQIEHAVHDSNPHDVILVKNGTYEPFDVAQSLCITGIGLDVKIDQKHSIEQEELVRNQMFIRGMDTKLKMKNIKFIGSGIDQMNWRYDPYRLVVIEEGAEVEFITCAFIGGPGSIAVYANSTMTVHNSCFVNNCESIIIAYEAKGVYVDTCKFIGLQNVIDDAKIIIMDEVSFAQDDDVTAVLDGNSKNVVFMAINNDFVGVHCKPFERAPNKKWKAELISKNMWTNSALQYVEIDDFQMM